MTLLLSRDDLARLLDVGQVIDACQAAFAAYSAGRTVTPLRVGVEPPGGGGVLLAMPCAVAPDPAGSPGALGTKIVSVFRGNPARGLPTITSLYVLSEYDTGAPLAVMDGTHLTAVRTAAGSAVATRLLARPDATSLGVFGTGLQAWAHVAAIRRVRPIERVVVVGTSPEKGGAFAARVRQHGGLDAQIASAAEAAACDVLALCTTSGVPVLRASDVRPGAHVNAVGAFTPETRELPTDLVAAARVYVDSRAGAFAEAGDLRLAAASGAFHLDQVVGEVGDVVLGTAPGRGSDAEITLYKSVGAAFLDAATARLAYDIARSVGVGTTFGFA